MYKENVTIDVTQKVGRIYSKIGENYIFYERGREIC